MFCLPRPQEALICLDFRLKMVDHKMNRNITPPTPAMPPIASLLKPLSVLRDKVTVVSTVLEGVAKGFIVLIEISCGVL